MVRNSCNFYLWPKCLVVLYMYAYINVVIVSIDLLRADETDKLRLIIEISVGELVFETF